MRISQSRCDKLFGVQSLLWILSKVCLLQSLISLSVLDFRSKPRIPFFDFFFNTQLSPIALY